ncbi:MAG: phosphoglycerate dehydrogenase [Flintibacter sp.]|uniref:phosphoglycerate dehydrogenase n=1 Tax=Flintibacter sp. TaxID=1918624 RepID=UPI0026721460|nr:phosphoglycerate dehydrogenase [Flintibacter sp.]MCI6148957.1 phosphoglycerate dehydrogenase [Flintibacter sp.]MDD7116373.1 phosphoglycerate dehydrogenase [Flintibacter sp.]MDY5037833.1 phosphoglycerate dehydrogenase [Lawsonibacter sp.]
MYRIKTLNKISSAGLDQLDKSRFQAGNDVENEDGILVRSAAMHDYVFPDALRAIARAGAGTNNIPIDRCSENGIVVFNTPGANANAVKELVIAALLIASRDILGGAEWVQEQAHTPNVDLAAAVEKGKSAFVGPELYRKTLGVIGLGAIGALVCNIALDLGMDVYGYDPFLSVDAALRLDRHVHVVKSVDELYKVSDYITIHVPYTNDTKDFINAEAISKMKGQVRVLNLARGGLVNDDDMIAALESGRVAKYVTDFPNDKIALVHNVIALPHLGASTPESEENCARMAADQLKDYLINGNIKNSVNLPNVHQDWSGISRVCLIHKNIPAMLTKITTILSDEGVNVENLTNKSKKDYAYTMVDLNGRIKDAVADELRAIPGMIRVRVINH